VEEPHPNSYASLVQLNKHLYMQTDDCLLRWLKFRKEYLRQHLDKVGVLCCDYCGKPSLKINTKDLSKLATIDHKVPLSKTRNKFDKHNFAVACCSCNQAKGTMPEWEFRKHLFFKAIRNSWATRAVVRLFGKYCFCSLKMCLTLM